MSAHTPGRLNYAYDGKKVAAGGVRYCSLEAFTTPGEYTVIAKGVLSPDARRLAACWNALEGTLTEEIEGFMAQMAGVREHIGVVGRLHIERQDELAAARALLAEVLALDDAALTEIKSIGMTLGEMTSPTGITERIRTFLEPKS